MLELNQRLAEHFQATLAASQASLTEARARDAERPPVAPSSRPRVSAGGVTAVPPGRTSTGPNEGVGPKIENGEDRDEGVVGAPADEEGPPLEVIVAAEQSEVSAVAPSTPLVRRQAEDDAGPTPPLSELLPRVPAALQEAMDELFRARFVRVTRVPDAATRPAAAEARGV